MRHAAPLKMALALCALLAGACNTPRDAAQSDTAAGGSPTAKLDSTSNPATIEGKTDSVATQPGGTPPRGTPPRAP